MVASASAVCVAVNVTAPEAVTVVPTTAWTVLCTVAREITHDTVRAPTPPALIGAVAVCVAVAMTSTLPDVVGHDGAGAAAPATR